MLWWLLTVQLHFTGVFSSTLADMCNCVLWAEAPTRAEFLQKRLISAFFGFQWQNLAEILHLFKKYNNIGKVAVKRVSWTDYAL